MTTFDDTLSAIAEYLRVPADVLAVRSEGYPFADVPFGEFPHGGIYPGEGRLLWTLVRLQKPSAALELGTHSGGSATIIASALKANGHGFLTTMDIDPGAGWLLPDDVREFVRFQTADIDRWIMEEPVAAYDFVFEDGAHSKHQVHTLYLNRHKFLKPDGLILSHDALVEGAGLDVQYGLKQGGATGAKLFAIEDSHLGISLYCAGSFTAAPQAVLQTANKPKQEVREAAIKKPAVKRRKKAARD